MYSCEINHLFISSSVHKNGSKDNRKHEKLILAQNRENGNCVIYWIKLILQSFVNLKRAIHNLKYTLRFSRIYVFTTTLIYLLKQTTFCSKQLSVSLTRDLYVSFSVSVSKGAASQILLNVSLLRLTESWIKKKLSNGSYSYIGIYCIKSKISRTCISWCQQIYSNQNCCACKCSFYNNKILENSKTLYYLLKKNIGKSIFLCTFSFLFYSNAFLSKFQSKILIKIPTSVISFIENWFFIISLAIFKRFRSF